MSDSNLKSKFTKHHCSLPFKGRLDPFRNVKVNFVKKWYLKAVIVSERHPLQHFYLQSSGAVAFEKRRHILSRFWYVIHPYSVFAAIWQILLGGVTLLTTCNLPWCHQTVFYFVFGRFIIFLDFLNLVNIVVLFFTGYTDKETMEIVLNHKLIIENYLSGYFYMDILGALPIIELWQTVTPYGSNNDFNIKISALGYFRLLQLRIFFRYIHTTFALFKANEYYIHVFRVSWVFFLVIHTLTCLVSYIVFFVHGTNLIYEKDSWVNQPPSTGDETPFSYIVLNHTYTRENGEKVYHYIEGTENDPFRYYIICNTRVMCMLYPLGFGRNDAKNPEDEYVAIVILLTGRVLALYIMEKLLKFRGWIKSPGVKYHMLMKQVNQYMRRKQLSPNLQRHLVSQALESVYNPEYPSNTAVAEVSLNLTGSSIYSLTGSSMDYFEDSTSQPQQHSFDSSYTNGSSSALIESGQVPSQQQTTGSTHSEKHQSKVRLFYEYRFDKRYFEERAVLANLSQNLRAEIRNHECRRLVNESVLFRNAPSHVVERILARLKHDVYLPNDVVVRAGQAGDCMFFLVSGTVAVVSRAGDEMLHLRDGAFFGELALLSVDERRMATVVAIEVCEVYRLDKEDFQQVVRPLRDMYDHIQEVAQKRLGELLAVEAMYKRLQSATA